MMIQNSNKAIIIIGPGCSGNPQPAGLCRQLHGLDLQQARGPGVRPHLHRGGGPDYPGARHWCRSHRVLRGNL